VLVTRAMPAETVGRAMALDAITYHQSGDEGAAAGNVMVADNNAIHRLAQAQEQVDLLLPPLVLRPAAAHDQVKHILEVYN